MNKLGSLKDSNIPKRKNITFYREDYNKKQEQT